MHYWTHKDVRLAFAIFAGTLSLLIAIFRILDYSKIDNPLKDAGWFAVLFIILCGFCTAFGFLAVQYLQSIRISKVMFWNNVQDREGDDIDVTRLIKRAKFDIFLSGITLNYVIESQAELIRTAIKERGVRVLIVIASDSNNSECTYKRYTRNIDERLPQSHRNYCDFFSTLTLEEAGRIDIRETALLITHSIGMYDKEIYITKK